MRSQLLQPTAKTAGHNHNLESRKNPQRFSLGQAFHWIERDTLLSVQDHLITPDGAVIVVGGPAPGNIEPPAWIDVITEVRTRYLGPERRAASSTYSHPKESHQEVLARSPFSHIEVAHWDRTITRDLDSVIGLRFSYSYSSPAQLGDQTDAFECDLRETLTAFNPEGVFDELVRTEAITPPAPDCPCGGHGADPQTQLGPLLAAADLGCPAPRESPGNEPEPSVPIACAASVDSAPHVPSPGHFKIIFWDFSGTFHSV